METDRGRDNRAETKYKGRDKLSISTWAPVNSPGLQQTASAVSPVSELPETSANCSLSSHLTVAVGESPVRDSNLSF